MIEKSLYADNDFGEPLADVAERDIDLLLLEQFRLDIGFVEWFCSKLNLREVRSDGAWHSIFNSCGETDLTLRVVSGNQRWGVLIENKIAAPEQENQGKRYLTRGENAVSAKMLDRFCTVLCAPRKYLDGLEEQTYQFHVAYEEIADWFRKQTGKHYGWRAYVMTQAIAQGKRGYVMIVDREITAFHKAYWNYMKLHHPQFVLPEPKQKGRRSDWINMKFFGFPKGAQLHHKFTGSTMELGFADSDIDDLLNTRINWMAEGIYVAQRGREACLVIDLPNVKLKEDFDEQLPKVKEAIEAAYRLARYAQVLQPDFLADKFVGRWEDFDVLKRVEPLSPAEIRNLSEEKPTGDDLSPNFPPLKSRLRGFHHAHRDGVSLFG